MSDPDPQPRPPRRRINGVTWGLPLMYEMYELHIARNGTVFDMYNLKNIGLAMGCVKDDDGQLPDRFTEEAG